MTEKQRQKLVPCAADQRPRCAHWVALSMVTYPALRASVSSGKIIVAPPRLPRGFPNFWIAGIQDSSSPAHFPHDTIASHSTPFTPGTRLGPYEILAPIGAGGMGEVYKAGHQKGNRKYADPQGETARPYPSAQPRPVSALLRAGASLEDLYLRVKRRLNCRPRRARPFKIRVEKAVNTEISNDKLAPSVDIELTE